MPPGGWHLRQLFEDWICPMNDCQVRESSVGFNHSVKHDSPFLSVRPRTKRVSGLNAAYQLWFLHIITSSPEL